MRIPTQQLIFSITVNDVEAILGRELNDDQIDLFKRKFTIEGWVDEIESFAQIHDIDNAETLKEKFENERERADILVDKNEQLHKEIDVLKNKISELEDFKDRASEFEQVANMIMEDEEQEQAEQNFLDNKDGER